MTSLVAVTGVGCGDWNWPGDHWRAGADGDAGQKEELKPNGFRSQGSRTTQTAVIVGV